MPASAVLKRKEAAPFASRPPVKLEDRQFHLNIAVERCIPSPENDGIFSEMPYLLLQSIRLTQLTCDGSVKLPTVNFWCAISTTIGSWLVCGYRRMKGTQKE